jgi:alkanesulfonate monooxygenase SsuD/methylene tetrahydromethanopterin reductase-like flavin-dependent oxidoreductase (luciferase family)
VRFGVSLPNVGIDPASLVELAVDAERAGWDGVFVWDAIFGINPWVELTAMAGRTERVRLGPLVTPLARRRPWTLAGETASLDRLARGRLILPVGLGAEEQNWAKVGEEESNRLKAKRLDEGLAILTGLWTGEAFSYGGEIFQVKDVTLDLKPAQSPRIPIWVSGSWPNPPETQRRRMLRWDGVLGGPDVDFRSLRAYLDANRESATPFDLITEGDTPGDDAGRAAGIIQPLADAGVTWWLEAAWRKMDTSEGLAGLRQRIQQGPPT